MKNGRADHDDDPERDPKIASIEEARRRRQLGLDGGNGQGKSGQGKSGGKAGQGARRPLMSGSGGVKEFVMGAVIVAMAVGLIVSVTRPLWQGALSIAP